MQTIRDNNNNNNKIHINYDMIHESKFIIFSREQKSTHMHEMKRYEAL